MKAIIPDTNFWLHAQLPFDFAAVAGTTDVVVVVPQVVLSELDRHQHEGRRHVKTRARECVMAFSKLMEGSRKRSLGFEATDDTGVTYRLVPTPPSASGSPDDKIVAAAGQLAREANVAILTADASMKMTAMLVGMEVVAVPPEMLERGDVDPLEQAVAQLKREVAQLRTPQPLVVEVEAQQLWPPDAPARLRRLSLPTYDRLADIQRSLPDRMSRRRPGARTSIALERYHSELPAYAEAVVSYLAALARYNALAEAAVEVRLLLTNRTAEPVAETVIEINAPTGVVLDYPPSRPSAPQPPKDSDRYHSLAEMLASQELGLLHSPRAFLSPLELPPTAPRVSTGESWARVKLSEPLRPDFPTYGGSLWVALAPEYPDEDIRLPYVLYAAVASRPVNGEIVIAANHHREPWVQPELPSYMYPNLNVTVLEPQNERQFRAKL